MSTNPGLLISFGVLVGRLLSRNPPGGEKMERKVFGPAEYIGIKATPRLRTDQAIAQAHLLQEMCRWQLNKWVSAFLKTKRGKAWLEKEAKP